MRASATALPHAARQLMRIVPGELEEVEVFQQRLRAPLALGQREPLDFDAEHHVLEHGAPGQQQVLLQHEGDVGVRAFHALAVDEGLAFARRAETRTDVEQGRFSAAAGTDERDHLAVTDCKAHTLDGGEAFPERSTKRMVTLRYSSRTTSDIA